MNNNYLTGNNSHGFKNEQSIVDVLNGARYKDLNIHLKKFISQICEDNHILLDDNMIVQSKMAKKEIDPTTNKKINPKPDLYIILGDTTFGISTKMGSGNSVHQEKVESFIDWIKNNNSIVTNDENIYDNLRLLIWGDGTLDGSAPINKDSKGFVIGRFTTTEFKSLYPNVYKNIKSFLNDNSVEIIKRALFTGKTMKEIHYIYHGTPVNGVWISQKEILDFNLNNPLNSSAFNVGRLSFQIYNADKKGTPSGGKKRGQVQFKYGKLESDIQSLILLNSSNIGTYEGNLEEFNFSKMMNRNNKHPFWRYLKSNLNLDNKEYYYVVKVEGDKYSVNAEKKVTCKTDNYLIQTSNPIDRNLLFKNEYQITEFDLPKIGKYNIIMESGISIKQTQSKSYTITKMTVKTFISAFSPFLSDSKYLCAALIFYCTKSQVNKNYRIAEDLKIDEHNFIDYMKNSFNISIKDLLDYNALAQATLIVKELIKQTIENNLELKIAIFSGKGWFEPPYYTNFLYSSGELTNNIFVDYRIDNGSGRSKGKYNIIIKPV